MYANKYRIDTEEKNPELYAEINFLNTIQVRYIKKIHAYTSSVYEINSVSRKDKTISFCMNERAFRFRSDNARGSRVISRHNTSRS